VGALKSVLRGALAGFQGNPNSGGALLLYFLRLSRAKIAAGGNPPSVAPAAITFLASCLGFLFASLYTSYASAPAAITFFGPLLASL
jgi:hypothetical protein